jgi:hypothetical protein
MRIAERTLGVELAVECVQTVKGYDDSITRVIFDLVFLLCRIDPYDPMMGSAGQGIDFSTLKSR